MSAQMIDHQDAVKSLMAERYLLGELNAGEREAYEEHLFSCDACFEQVKAGTEFVGHLRRMGPEEPRPVLVPGFLAYVIRSLRQPVAVTALGLFLCVSGVAIHQNAVISRLKEPGPELRFTLTGVAHGDSAVKLVEAAKNSRLSLNVEYARKGEFISYQAKILSGSEKSVHTVALPADQVGTMASIAMPSEALEPGPYSIVVSGLKSDGTLEEVGRGAFELKFKDQ